MPLNTAIIGLSSSAITSWAAKAHLPPLSTSKGKSLFAITALLNSSEDAARAAASTFDLGSHSVKAYGSPEDLAADESVDFVICNTRVDKHLETTLPSLKAGKAAYIEWPIAKNLDEIQQLVDAAAASGKPVAVGLQGRYAPPVLKVKQVLQSGAIGKLLSTEIRAFGGTVNRDSLPPGLKYFADREIGGNPITIGAAHVIDFVQSVVGDVIPGSDHVHFQIQRPRVGIKDPATGHVVETVTSTVPDLFSLHGSLPETDHVGSNASLVFYFARGQPYPGDPPFTWTLNGEHGSIRLVAFGGSMLQADVYQLPVTISVHHFDTDTVEDIPWDWTAVQKEISISGRSVQTCLYSLAEGGKDYVSLEDAAGRARQIMGWLKTFHT
ncbi:oxidoreductase [Aspergillus unguis]